VLEAQKGISDVHLRRDLGHPEVCVHYDPALVTLPQVLALARSAGAEVSSRYRQKTFFVRGMESAQCAYVIEHVLNRTPGVLQASVAYAAERLVLEYDSKVLNMRDVEKRIQTLGYDLEEPQSGCACSCHAHGGGLAPRLEMPLVILAGLLLLAGYAWHYVSATQAGAVMNDHNIPLASTLLYVLALVAGGFFAVRGAVLSVLHGVVDIEVLMVLAGAGAGLLNKWFEGAFLLFLFSLGHALEHRAMERARRAIEALGRLRPETARLKTPEGLREVPIGEVRRGDVVVVRPGDRVPLDGTIRSGQSSLDQATITGESIPVPRGPGDTVYAGTVNVDGVLEVEVTRLSSESVLARIVNMVAEAEAHKGPSQLFAKRLEKRFVPIVLAGAPLLSLSLLILGSPQVGWIQPVSFADAILRGISVLVAASPCALAISTPAAVLSAVARAARAGVIIKGGAYLETLGRVSSVAFDKTGTLTVGKPRVVDVLPCDGCSEKELLAIAAGAEAHSSHPLARAVVAEAAGRGVKILESSQCQAIHGKGLRAVIDGQAVAVGSLALFDGRAVPEAVGRSVARLQEAGRTAVVVERAGRFVGVLGIADTLRPEARSTIEALARLGVRKTLVLSGDNHLTARAIASEAGIAEVRAPLLPEDKVKSVRELARQYQVAMVGDGVNDAPALAAASVGIAMGGAGSDVALETADLVLMGDALHKLPLAVHLARVATGVIRQNMTVALGVSALLVLASVFGWVEISQAVIFHEGSTLVVVANGLRLLGFRSPYEGGFPALPRPPALEPASATA
jgi:Cd2+/Zn2+-exporting ATPase